MLASYQKNAGFIHNMHAIMVESPVMLKAYKEIGKRFGESSFTPIE